MTAVPRPALTAPERAQLIGWLDHQRSFVRMKCAGLSEARRRVRDASLRYVLCHMIEETARHVGHLDIIRELIDGRTGCIRLKEETA